MKGFKNEFWMNGKILWRLVHLGSKLNRMLPIRVWFLSHDFYVPDTDSDFARIWWQLNSRYHNNYFILSLNGRVTFLNVICSSQSLIYERYSVCLVSMLKMNEWANKDKTAIFISQDARFRFKKKFVQLTIYLLVKKLGDHEDKYFLFQFPLNLMEFLG